ncbi:MAG: flagellar hook-associated protein FlgK [Azospirillaceae bacterium]|nr:flagellar hook-associated protein FlgK [Azospirillaceae bacterium]
MSLTSALSNATSGLRAVSAQISAASNNISNANTSGYSTKTQQVSTAVNGTSTDGVKLGAVTRDVDQYLLADKLSATSENASASYSDYVLGQLTDAYGTSTSGNSFANQFSSLQSAFSTLQATPNSTTLQTEVVTKATNLANSINSAGKEVTSLRTESQNQMTTSVSAINTDLNQINTLNSTIVAGQAAGQSVADLQDQRDKYLTDLSSQIGITYYTTSSGAVQISTAGGATLLDSTVHSLSFTANNVTASSQYVAGSTSGSPVLQGIYVDGSDITSSLGTSGTLGAAINLRDNVLPQAQGQLDEYATELTNGFSQFQVTTTTTNPTTTAALQLFQDSSSSAPDYSTGTTTAATSYSAGIATRIEVNPTVASNVWMVRDGNVSISGGTASTQTESSNSGNSTLLGALVSQTQTTSSTSSSTGSPLEGTITFSSTVTPSASAVSLNLTTSATLADYATSIIGYQSTQKATASSSYTSAASYLTTATTNLSNQSSVSLDVELEKLVTLQNSYSAVAKTISTVNSMYGDLLGIVG